MLSWRGIITNMNLVFPSKGMCYRWIEGSSKEGPQRIIERRRRQAFMENVIANAKILTFPASLRVCIVSFVVSSSNLFESQGQLWLESTACRRIIVIHVYFSSSSFLNRSNSTIDPHIPSSFPFLRDRNHHWNKQLKHASSFLLDLTSDFERISSITQLDSLLLQVLHCLKIPLNNNIQISCSCVFFLIKVAE